MTITLENLHGRLLDCDSHLQLAPHQFSDAMGVEFAERYRTLEDKRLGMKRIEDAVAQGKDVELDAASVWRVKGWASPAAFDADKRLAALDLMGIERQVLFPIAYFAAVAVSPLEGASRSAGIYNDYVLDWSKNARGRLRPVAMLPMHDAGGAVEEARRVVDAGAYAVNIAIGRPPAGLSPAHTDWDPLWALLADANVPVLLHIGGDAGFFDRAWSRIPSLEAHALPHGGEALGPFNLATFHFAPQMYLTSLVLGGVFERHPTLRVGVIELTAQWVGPMAEMLDQRVDVFAKRMSKLLSMKPSEYLSRNVRVTPFWWEPVDRYIDRYGLEDVYVFSTDFPHPEGGTDPLPRFFGNLARFGDELIEKFFVRNAELILPARP